MLERTTQMSNDHHHHSGATHLAELAILGAILTLPSNILRTAAKRLAILVGIFALIVVGLITALNLSTPVCHLGRSIDSPTSNDRQLCKQTAEKMEREKQAALAELEGVLERDRPLKP
jgi:hypothetical protein